MSTRQSLAELKKGIIVSCQANPGNPFYGPVFMAAMAQASEKGGACAVRVNGVEDIKAVKKAVNIPVIGSNRIFPPTEDVYITPSFEMAREIVAAGTDIVTLDGTLRPRRSGITLRDLIKRIKEELGVMVMADISTEEEGKTAADYGADLIATTLAGFTPYSTQQREPDFELVEKLAGSLDLPVVAEGRIWTIEHMQEAFSRGAYAVVIGTAITNPMAVTERFVENIKAVRKARF